MPRTSTVPVRLLSCSLIASRIFSVECMGQLLTLHFWCLNLSHGLFKDHPSEASGLFPIDPQVYHDYFVHIFGLQYELLFFCVSILIFLFHFSLPFASHSMTFSGTLSFNLIYFFLFSLPDILKTSLVTQPISGWCLHHKLALAHQAHHSLRCSSPNHCDLSLSRTHQFVRVLEQKIRVPRLFESTPVTSTLKFKIEPGVE